MSEEVPATNQQNPLEGQNSLDQELDQITNAPGSLASTEGAPENEESADVKLRMEEMEKEAAKLRKLHSELSDETGDNATLEEKKDIDSRSIYVGNVDYSTTPLELQQFFSGSGVVNRVTIPLNKFNGQPKGFAYLEFADVDAVNKAVATLDGATFRDREIKVSAKRTNLPGISSTNRGGFGRGGPRFRGFRGSGRGFPRGRGFSRGRGSGRGSSRFTPY